MTKETLHTYQLPTGPMHVVVREDHTFMTTTGTGLEITRMSDLGETTRVLTDLGLDPTPVAEAAWKRILRRRSARSDAMESRDDLSLALESAGVCHIGTFGEGYVSLTLTVADAERLTEILKAVRS